MHLLLPAALAAGLLAALPDPVAPAAAGDPEPRPTVEFARTWDRAVAEARLLNLPLVIHNHGFY